MFWHPQSKSIVQGCRIAVNVASTGVDAAWCCWSFTLEWQDMWKLNVETVPVYGVHEETHFFIVGDTENKDWVDLFRWFGIVFQEKSFDPLMAPYPPRHRSDSAVSPEIEPWNLWNRILGGKTVIRIQGGTGKLGSGICTPCFHGCRPKCRPDENCGDILQILILRQCIFLL